MCICYRVPETLEALCVLAIQAYAELNSWQEVLPFVQNIYRSIECCPYKVIQLCLLLHAKVHEYPQCHALTSIWLRHPDNISHPDYKELVTTYIHYVLQPQNKCDSIPQFLDSCPGLTSEDKIELQKNLKQVTSENKTSDDYLSKGSLNSDESSINESATEDINQKDNMASEFWLSKIAHGLGEAVRKSSVYLNLKSLIKLAALAVCLCFFTIKATKVDPLSSTGYITILWQGAFKFLKTLFGPARVPK